MDDDFLPESWHEWLDVAEEMEARYRRDGVHVIRVPLDPATFPKWCHEQGFRVADGRARLAYASWYATRMGWH
jgi:hypothetical protein